MNGQAPLHRYGPMNGWTAWRICRRCGVAFSGDNRYGLLPLWETPDGRRSYRAIPCRPRRRA